MDKPSGKGREGEVSENVGEEKQEVGVGANTNDLEQQYAARPFFPAPADIATV